MQVASWSWQSKWSDWPRASRKNSALLRPVCVVEGVQVMCVCLCVVEGAQAVDGLCVCCCTDLGGGDAEVSISCLHLWALHLIFWDKVFYWTRGLLYEIDCVWTAWLISFWGPYVSPHTVPYCIVTEICHCCCIWMWMLGLITYPLSHLFDSRIISLRDSSDVIPSQPVEPSYMNSDHALTGTVLWSFGAFAYALLVIQWSTEINRS